MMRLGPDAVYKKTLARVLKEFKIKFFMDRVTKLDSGCWQYLKNSMDQHSSTSIGGRQMNRSRLVYQLFYGKLSEKYVVHHTCEVKGCVNPAHLEALTPLEHSRLHKKNRSNKKYGGPIGISI